MEQFQRLYRMEQMALIADHLTEGLIGEIKPSIEIDEVAQRFRGMLKMQVQNIIGSLELYQILKATMMGMQQVFMGLEKLQFKALLLRILLGYVDGSELSGGATLDSFPDMGELNSPNVWTWSGWTGILESSSVSVPAALRSLPYNVTHYPTASAYYYHYPKLRADDIIFLGGGTSGTRGVAD